MRENHHKFHFGQRQSTLETLAGNKKKNQTAGNWTECNSQSIDSHKYHEIQLTINLFIYDHGHDLKNVFAFIVQAVVIAFHF